ncbi:MAG TPA: DinB family protein [Chryseolinea sp.]|nr:DinB family protein [Chryseolinea sp.]
MKKIVLAATCFLFAHFAMGQTLSPDERRYVVELLEANANKFLADIEDVTDKQWKFKPVSNVWSVGEVSEHITLSEGLLFSIVQKTLAAPPDCEKAKTLAGNEKQLLVSVMDRSVKAQAPEVISPSGSFATKKELIEAFKIARDKTINYVKTTEDPLKNHIARHPAFGELTTYQWLVFIAGHANRHVAQLEEVKKNINFPKT